MKFVTSIGLEVHVQLDTRTKMFCGCATASESENTATCPVCLGYPGAMPVMNEEAIRRTVLAGLMLGAEINTFSKFDRKSYFYPDMPKNYQISQYDRPLCVGGGVTIGAGADARLIRLTRIHLEEDVAKCVHYEKYSGVDFNRAGIPLMEIVTEPDMTAPEEAFEFLQNLRRLLLYAGVSECNLEAGNMRCDVNVSVRSDARADLGTKIEIKNMNTFKGVLHALRYEVGRQSEALRKGGRIVQETRRWDPDAERTFTMRVKEDAHDYRYFPEPDLLPVVLEREQIEAWGATLPERPEQKRRRFIADLGLPEYDAEVLSADRRIAEFFERAAARGQAKRVSNLMMTEVMRLLAESGKSLEQARLSPEALAELAGLLAEGVINQPTAKMLLPELFEKGGMPARIVKARGLAQVSNAGELDRWIRQAIEANPAAVKDFFDGKKAAAKFLVGQVMKLSRGKAAPREVGIGIQKALSERTAESGGVSSLGKEAQGDQAS